MLTGKLYERESLFSRVVAVVCAITMVVSLMPMAPARAYAGEGAGLKTASSFGALATKELPSNRTITDSDTYDVPAGTEGEIVIGEEVSPTLVGPGIDTALNLFITVGSGSTVTIQGLSLSVNAAESNAINFLGSGGLAIKGENLIDSQNGTDNYYAAIHVGGGKDNTVTFSGDGVLYGYKSSMGALIGSNGTDTKVQGDTKFPADPCGNITFDGGTWLLKGSAAAAVIGNDTASENLGTVTFNGGEVHAKGVAQAATIGGSKSGYAPDVVVNGGLVESLTDYYGSSIGAGATGITAGSLTVNGGSLKTVMTDNCFGTGKGTAVWDVYKDAYEAAKSDENVHAVASDWSVTASHDTALLVFDASAYAEEGSIDVKVDDGAEAFYSGGLYRYVTNEIKNPIDDEKNFVTARNWLSNDQAWQDDAYEANATRNADYSSFAPDANLYLYLSKTAHTLTVGDDTYAYKWDEDSASFLRAYGVSVDEGIDGGTLEVSQENAYEGDVVTVAAQANDDYLIGAVTYEYDGETYEAAYNGESYTFTMPASDVTVSATFVSTATAAIAAPLVGNGNPGESAAPDDYGITQAFSDDDGVSIVDVAFSATGLVKHMATTGSMPEGYWAGIGIPATVGDGASYIGGFGEYAADGPALEPDFKGYSPQGSSIAYNTFYFNARTAKAVHEGKAYVAAKDADDHVVAVYSLDLSGVLLKNAVSVDEAIENGTVAVDIEDGEAIEGDEVAIEVTPDAGYDVGTVIYNGTEIEPVDDTYSFTMPADPVTVSATFTPKSYSLTAASSEHGTITLSPAAGSTVDFGTEVTATVTPAEGYKAVGVTYTYGETSAAATRSDDGSFTFTMPDGDAEASAVIVSEGTWDGAADASWYDASGTSFTVSTPEQLAGLAAIVNGTAEGVEQDSFSGKTVTLGNDVALGDADAGYLPDWTPVGTAATAFAGTFDGAGHTVSGLSITSSGEGYKALFGNNSGTVKDFTVAGSVGAAEAGLGGKDCFAGAVAYNTGAVERVVNRASVYIGVTSTYATGGVVGRNDGGTVAQCGNQGAVQGAESADVQIYKTGGVVGELVSGAVSECYNAAHVEGWSYRKNAHGTGGVVGYAAAGSVTFCYNTGSVENGEYGNSSVGGKGGAGGIVGGMDGACSVTNCYATGDVTGPSGVGVLVGRLGTGAYDRLFSLYGAKANTDDGGWTSYTGADENADGSILTGCKYGKQAWGNTYSGGLVEVTNSYTKSDDALKSSSMVVALNTTDDGVVDKFNKDADSSLNGGFPVLAWQGGQAVADLSGAGVAGVSDENAVSATAPSITVTLDGKALTDDDYAVAFTSKGGTEVENPLAVAGDYTMTVEGIGSYGGTVVKEFKVIPALSSCDIAAISGQPYTGAKVKPSVVLTYTDVDGQTITLAAKYYVVQYSNNVAVSDAAQVKVIGVGACAGTKAAMFSIEAADIADCTIASIPDQPYTGSEIEPAFTVTNAAGAELEEGVDYEVGYGNNVERGEANLVVLGIGDYTGALTGSFAIVSADLAEAGCSIAPIDPQPLGEAGTPVEPAIKLVDASGAQIYATGDSTTDYKVSYSNNTAAGNASVIVVGTGTGNYAGVVSGTFEIYGGLNADLSACDIDVVESMPYTGNPVIPDVEVSYDGTPLVQGAAYDYTVVVYDKDGATPASAVEPGQYTVKLVGMGDAAAQTGVYGEVSRTFEVEGYDVADLCSVASVANKPYTGAEVEPAVVVVNKRTGARLVADQDYSVIYYNNVEVGTAFAVVVGMGGYSGSIVKQFEIVPTTFSAAGVTVKVAAATYTGKALTPKLTVTNKYGVTLVSGVDYLAKYSNNVNAGTGKVTIVGWGAYSGTKAVEFEIAKAAQKITASATKFSKKATDKAFSLGAKSSGDGKPSFASNKTAVATVDASGKVTPVGAGTATITVTAPATANYKAATALKVTVAVTRADNTLKLKALTTTAKPLAASAKKATPFAASTYFSTTKNVSGGALSFSKKSGDAKITVASKTGKLSVGKGLKAGVYKAVIRVTSAQTAKYKNKAVDVTVYIKVS